MEKSMCSLIFILFDLKTLDHSQLKQTPSPPKKSTKLPSSKPAATSGFRKAIRTGTWQKLAGQFVGRECIPIITIYGVIPSF